jgi:hypothetical protein
MGTEVARIAVWWVHRCGPRPNSVQNQVRHHARNRIQFQRSRSQSCRKVAVGVALRPEKRGRGILFWLISASSRSRCRQCNRERVTTQDHEGDQPPDCALAVNIGTQAQRHNESVRSRFPSAPWLKIGESPTLVLTLPGKSRAFRWPSIAEQRR